MKPISTNNLSAWGFIGLFILFSMPYIGVPALIIFAIFGHGAAKSFARALIILEIIGYVALFVLMFVLEINLEPYFSFDEGGVEVFRYVSSLIG